MMEDERLIVVDKPPGVVVHPAPGHRGTTLVEFLAGRAGGSWTPHVVHRLDRDTSGLMLVAKDEGTAERLRALIRRRELVREYLALVKGRPPARSGTIDAPLGRDPRRRTTMSTRSARPRAARTHFEVVSLLEGYTLLRARLETGRTHQIRAHFAAVGTPICGDRAYGGTGMLGLARQFLHSARLAFEHPAGGPVDLSSPLPGDLEAALERAGRPDRGPAGRTGSRKLP
jgi:23S rRNA pseudouridine1911/1915/1917 synthase